MNEKKSKLMTALQQYDRWVKGGKKKYGFGSHDQVNYPYGGYRLSWSGCGAISCHWLDDNSARVTESIICKSCVKGLKIYGFSHLPENPCGETDEGC